MSYLLSESELEEIKKQAVAEYLLEHNEILKNRWIPCSERLPETEGNYLVTRDNGTVDTGIFLIWANGGCFNSYDDLYRFPEKKVIAWQPLPKPYEEKQKFS